MLDKFACKRVFSFEENVACKNNFEHKKELNQDTFEPVMVELKKKSLAFTFCNKFLIQQRMLLQLKFLSLEKSAHMLNAPHYSSLANLLYK
jgi:hypothetical protein